MKGKYSEKGWHSKTKHPGWEAQGGGVSAEGESLVCAKYAGGDEVSGWKVECNRITGV